jgi:hypothetical protein
VSPRPGSDVLYETGSNSDDITETNASRPGSKAASPFDLVGLPWMKHEKSTQPESSSGAYYVITEFLTCGLPEGHTRAKCLGDMVGALGLEPRTL